jgi:hypothetical protein
MKGAASQKKLIHLVIGIPDVEHCPICRAHVQGTPGPGEDGAAGSVLVQELRPEQILRCSCPLCEQVKQEPRGD